MNAKLHDKIKKTNGRFAKKFFRQANFTVCVLIPIDTSGDMVVGVAKRDPNTDLTDNQERARGIALARAVKQLDDLNNITRTQEIALMRGARQP